MDITIVRTQQESSLDSTVFFGILLSKTLTLIHMTHWYILNHNVHEILGDLYEDLDGLFDKLQEEIIGTSKLQGKTFPSFSPETLNIDDINQYSGDNQDLLEVYYKTTIKLTAILNSLEFSNYVESVDSGLNNTKEDILSRINKANYLLAMIQL
jgi:DNA-binding ferritin-like protein